MCRCLVALLLLVAFTACKIRNYSHRVKVSFSYSLYLINFYFSCFLSQASFLNLTRINCLFSELCKEYLRHLIFRKFLLATNCAFSLSRIPLCFVSCTYLHHRDSIVFGGSLKFMMQSRTSFDFTFTDQY